MTYNEQFAIQDICLDLTYLIRWLNEAASTARQNAEGPDIDFKVLGRFFLMDAAITAQSCEERAKKILSQLLVLMNDSDKDYFSQLSLS